MKKIKIIFLCLTMLPLFSCATNYSSWHLNEMQIDKLWEYSKGDSQVIAFIDTGISDAVQLGLQDRITYAYDVIEQKKTAIDTHGHGTEMVSVACGDGTFNVWGIAPNAKILIIKAVSDDGKTDNEYLYQALKIAENHDATIVNISIGGHKESDKVTGQINTMLEHGITVVAAGGDYDNKDLLFPSSINGVVSVEASTESGGLWKESNHSEDSVMRMPGCNIDVLTLGIDGKVHKDVATGTSQATAITSGYIALIKDYYLLNGIQLNNEELIDVLKTLNTKEQSSIDYVKPFEAIKNQLTTKD